MQATVYVIRTLFTLLSILIATAYTTTSYPGGFTLMAVSSGIFLGLAGAFTFIFLEKLSKRLDFRSFNLSIIGLVLGYIFATLLMTILGSVVSFVNFEVQEGSVVFIKAVIYLLSTYAGVVLTVKASEEFHLSIPFVRLQPGMQKKKDIILDSSVLTDARLIDLAVTGLMDHHLVVPRFILKEAYENLESADDAEKARARRMLEVLKKLEMLPTLGVRYIETDFAEVHDLFAKVIRLARMTSANVLTSDMNRIQQATIESTEGIRIINLNLLSNALKPLTTSGEMLEIKIQRYGKESGQGVGYLEDGTMVVVNGGADFIGRIIKTHVLSVKHTSSGRMIFCNASEEEKQEEPGTRPSARSYFALER